MSDELKPCPFCGGVPVAKMEDSDEKTAVISCRKCPAEMSRHVHWHEDGTSEMSELVAAWNTRAPDEAAMRAGYEMAAKEAREIGVFLRRFDLALKDARERGDAG